MTIDGWVQLGAWAGTFTERISSWRRCRIDAVGSSPRLRPVQVATSRAASSAVNRRTTGSTCSVDPDEHGGSGAGCRAVRSGSSVGWEQGPVSAMERRRGGALTGAQRLGLGSHPYIATKDDRVGVLVDDHQLRSVIRAERLRRPSRHRSADPVVVGADAGQRFDLCDVVGRQYPSALR